MEQGNISSEQASKLLESQSNSNSYSVLSDYEEDAGSFSSKSSAIDQKVPTPTIVEFKPPSGTKPKIETDLNPQMPEPLERQNSDESFYSAKSESVEVSPVAHAPVSLEADSENRKNETIEGQNVPLKGTRMDRIESLMESVRKSFGLCFIFLFFPSSLSCNNTDAISTLLYGS